MMKKIAVAMIVASMSALPMASAAFAQSADGTSQSGQKPVDPKTGMPTNCRAGDTACSKTDPNAPDAGTTGAIGTKGAMDSTSGTQSMDKMGNPSAPDASPKCQTGDNACDPNAKN